ncbi:MAG: hypothetical protein B7Z12_20615 [Caulobacter vibrioides]|uniref:Uncharacterized protein n=1 Tax=Caulobacter vibrioides TaxID=155892 RepID=A0A258CRC3_CAUVI|nr:MAG: hypothetical protein B7Z12_20615 [Caulobacter vibrioides]
MGHGGYPENPPPSGGGVGPLGTTEGEEAGFPALPPPSASRTPPPLGGGLDYDAANFSSFTASKFCTPPPTRLVV